MKFDSDSKQILDCDCVGTDTSENNIDDSERVLVKVCMDTDKEQMDAGTSRNDADDLEQMDLSGGVKFLCALCDVTFSRKYSLRRHEKNIHSIDKTTCSQVCGVCDSKCRTITDLHKHIEIEHPDIKLIFHDEVFYCQSDFERWKCEVESLTVSSFILNFTRKMEDVEILSYKCHRSGKQSRICENPKGKKRRHAGTIKTGVTCPAIIKATKQTVHEATEITVRYQSTHLGHKCELNKLPLQKKERTVLAEMLSSPVSVKIIPESNYPNIFIEEGQLEIDKTAKEISENAEKNKILKQIQKKRRKELNEKKLVIEECIKNMSNKVQSLESLEDLQYVEDNLKHIQAYLETSKESELQTTKNSASN